MLRDRRAEKLAYNKIYRAEFPEKVKAQQKLWRLKNKENIKAKRAASGYYKDWEQRDVEKTKRIRTANRKKYRAKNPRRNAIYQQVFYALKIGKIKKGLCERCGCEKVEAHHEDYDKPLEVRWLCKKHHREIHSN